MERRDFLRQSAMATLGMAVVPSLFSCKGKPKSIHSKEYHDLCFKLLKDWLDGMMKIQVMKPSDPKVHGMLVCPACDEVHTRLMDAVYPFLYMAKATGDHKYLEAGIALMEWGDNVSRPDGAWTNELKPNSWDGITVFGAIALGEALHYHGDLLEAELREKWMKRLRAAAEFCYKKFSRIDVTNINYGATNIYAMHLLGEVLEDEKYVAQSKKLAEEIKPYFTAENKFLFGEIKPSADKLSPKGLHGVDLGYNVEESLNSLVMYALKVDDKELLTLLETALNTHLEFMIPDGGWDNGWGTRMFKWSYWGSRTCDGCQPAFGMMAGYNPAFGTAAFKNTELLQRCTADGLLHGGPHFVSHSIKPCVHHTFAHAKPLTAMLDHWEHLPKINKETPLPREVADGIDYYKDIDVALFARGDWRGTVSAYDAEYDPKGDYRQATGGALSLLYHNKVGLLCAASMAVYKLKEPYNQQKAPGEDIALTPRIESYKGEEWYTNLFDLEATFESQDKGGRIEIAAQCKLKNEAREVLDGTASDFVLNYRCSEHKMEIIASTQQTIEQATSFMLPIISPAGEVLKQISENVITIEKPKGTLKISSNVVLKIKEMPKSRTFNMVPGVEAIPVIAGFEEGKRELRIRLELI